VKLKTQKKHTHITQKNKHTKPKNHPKPPQPKIIKEFSNKIEEKKNNSIFNIYLVK